MTSTAQKNFNACMAQRSKKGAGIEGVGLAQRSNSTTNKTIRTGHRKMPKTEKMYGQI